MALHATNLSISALMDKVREKNKNRFRKSILKPLVEAGLIVPTITDKPNSSKQTYKLTDKAIDFIKLD